MSGNVIGVDSLSFFAFNPSFANIPTALLCKITKGFELFEPIDKSYNPSSAHRIRTPDCIVLQYQLPGQPVHIVVVDVEPLFSINSTTSAESRVKDFSFRR